MELHNFPKPFTISYLRISIFRYFFIIPRKNQKSIEVYDLLFRLSLRENAAKMADLRTIRANGCWEKLWQQNSETKGLQCAA
jgi:hypothetical protein